MAHRCRLCTANDQAELVERVAADLWESRRGGTLDDWPWNEAGAYWQPIMRQLAATAIASLQDETS